MRSQRKLPGPIHQTTYSIDGDKTVLSGWDVFVACICIISGTRMKINTEIYNALTHLYHPVRSSYTCFNFISVIFMRCSPFYNFSFVHIYVELCIWFFFTKKWPWEFKFCWEYTRLSCLHQIGSRVKEWTNFPTKILFVDGSCSFPFVISHYSIPFNKS